MQSRVTFHDHPPRCLNLHDADVEGFAPVCPWIAGTGAFGVYLREAG